MEAFFVQVCCAVFVATVAAAVALYNAGKNPRLRWGRLPAAGVAGPSTDEDLVRLQERSGSWRTRPQEPRP